MEATTGATKDEASSLDGGPAERSWAPRARSTAREAAEETPRRGGRRRVRAVLGAVVLAAIVGTICSLGPVRAILRQSFTRTGSPTTEFYLNGSPWVSGEYLEVPLGVIEQNGPSAGTFKVRLWTVDGAGRTVSAVTVALPYRDGQGAQNLSVQVPATAQIVWAQIVGTTLSLHYRIEGSALPSSSATASPVGKG